MGMHDLRDLSGGDDEAGAHARPLAPLPVRGAGGPARGRTLDLRTGALPDEAARRSAAAVSEATEASEPGMHAEPGQAQVYRLPAIERTRITGSQAATAAAHAAGARGPGRQQAASPTAVDPEVEARRIVDAARKAALLMVEQARDAIASDRETARREGYEAGRAEGLAEADRETAGLVATCEKIGLSVMQERERLLAESEGEVVELALAISERVVGGAIEADPELVVSACRAAMRKAFHRERLSVLAHPDDLAMLRAAGPRLAEELGGVEHLEFVEERRLQRGGVIIRTPAGEVDATLESKSGRISEALREGVESRRAQAREEDRQGTTLAAADDPSGDDPPGDDPPAGA